MSQSNTIPAEKLAIRRIAADEPVDLPEELVKYSDAIGALDEGRLGWIGMRWTCRVTNEIFIWLELRRRPTLGEVRGLRNLLLHLRPSPWMTIDRTKPELVRWAQFLGLEYIGPYDGPHDKYRRP